MALLGKSAGFAVWAAGYAAGLAAAGLVMQVVGQNKRQQTELALMRAQLEMRELGIRVAEQQLQIEQSRPPVVATATVVREIEQRPTYDDD